VTGFLILVAYLVLGAAVGAWLTSDLDGPDVGLIRWMFSIVTALAWPMVLAIVAWEAFTDPGCDR
jgi:uncharacterized membrane protein YfcA